MVHFLDFLLGRLASGNGIILFSQLLGRL
jgi:hypothetical protein